jgi:hypothetical protein
VADLRSVLDEDLNDISLAAEIADVKRELAMRERVYPRWVAAGKLTQAKADLQLRIMRRVLQRLLQAEQSGSLL